MASLAETGSLAESRSMEALSKSSTRSSSSSSTMSHLVSTLMCGSSSCTMAERDRSEPAMNFCGSAAKVASMRYTPHSFTPQDCSVSVSVRMTGTWE